MLIDVEKSSYHQLFHFEIELTVIWKNDSD